MMCLGWTRARCAEEPEGSCPNINWFWLAGGIVALLSLSAKKQPAAAPVGKAA